MPTKAKSWEPVYSQALNQNKIYTQALLPPGNLDQVATAALGLGLGEPGSVSLQAVEQ